MKRLSCILEAGKNILVRQSRVISQNLGFRPTLCQKIDYKFNGYTRTFDYRFSHKNFRVNRYTILPVHMLPPERSNSFCITVYMLFCHCKSEYSSISTHTQPKTTTPRPNSEATWIAGSAVPKRCSSSRCHSSTGFPSRLCA